MKKTYFSPELEVLCFAPCEKLANGIVWSPKDALGLKSYGADAETSTIETPIPSNPEGDM